VSAGLAASIRARLLRGAKERGEDFNLTLNRFAVERFLYRLSASPWQDKFLLKGALLFHLWFDVPHRPTRDADFLGFLPEDVETLRRAVQEICAIESDDAMAFHPDAMSIEEIREDARYGGLRVRLPGHLGESRCAVQLDVGYGDVVTPGWQEMTLPTLLEGLPGPRLRTYPRETVLSEKLEAIVSLGMANSRMKDFYDIRALILEGALDPVVLPLAIAATFDRRGTPVPDGIALGLSDEFALDAARQALWKAFLGKNRLDAPALPEVVAQIRDFLATPMQAATHGPRGQPHRRMKP
jgi:hypothetical protein